MQLKEMKNSKPAELCLEETYDWERSFGASGAA